jgi:hypothetical protein
MPQRGPETDVLTAADLRAEVARINVPLYRSVERSRGRSGLPPAPAVHAVRVAALGALRHGVVRAHLAELAGPEHGGRNDAGRPRRALAGRRAGRRGDPRRLLDRGGGGPDHGRGRDHPTGDGRGEPAGVAWRPHPSVGRPGDPAGGPVPAEYRRRHLGLGARPARTTADRELEKVALVQVPADQRRRVERAGWIEAREPLPILVGRRVVVPGGAQDDRAGVRKRIELAIPRATSTLLPRLCSAVARHWSLIDRSGQVAHVTRTTRSGTSRHPPRAFTGAEPDDLTRERRLQGGDDGRWAPPASMRDLAPIGDHRHYFFGMTEATSGLSPGRRRRRYRPSGIRTSRPSRKTGEAGSACVAPRRWARILAISPWLGARSQTSPKTPVATRTMVPPAATFA